jgi:hypothetical protein
MTIMFYEHPFSSVQKAKTAFYEKGEATINLQCVRVTVTTMSAGPGFRS